MTVRTLAQVIFETEIVEITDYNKLYYKGRLTQLRDDEILDFEIFHFYTYYYTEFKELVIRIIV